VFLLIPLAILGSYNLSSNVLKVSEFKKRESEAGFSVKKAALQDELKEEIRIGKPKAMQMTILKPLTSIQGVPRFWICVFKPQVSVCFPGCILLVPSEIRCESLPIIMLKSRLNLSDRSPKNRMLVNFHVQVSPEFFWEYLIFACADSEECQLSERVAMAQP
jgi:hypothetical protein